MLCAGLFKTEAALALLQKAQYKTSPVLFLILSFFPPPSSLQPKEEPQKVALCHMVEQNGPKSRTKPINDWQKVDFVSSA